jgi:hypothetical protein
MNLRDRCGIIFIFYILGIIPDPSEAFLRAIYKSNTAPIPFIEISFKKSF